MSSSGSAATLTFQQDVAGYSGAVDTYVRNDQATTSFGAFTLVLADRQSPLAQGLIRFENVIGDGAGRVPPGSLINSATLSVNVFNQGNTVNLHRMRVPWSNTSTWDSLVAGISLDDIEALGAVDASFTPFQNGIYVITVTSALQSWADDAAPNLGWVLICTGDDGVQFDSAEEVNASLRPLLTIEYTPGVTNAVAITSEPQDQSAELGRPFTFTVGNSGNAAQYQWYKGTSPIPDATNLFYQILNVQNSDAGFYHVVISNSVNGVASREAFLSVVAAPVTVVGLTNHVWTYDQSGISLGTAWRAIDFDDSAWPSGRGLLAQENNPIINPLTNTVLTLGSPSNPTFYFRTHFTLTNELADVILVSSNYFDDGAVIFLNGKEAFRYNLPLGPIGYNTLASAANPSGEGVFVVSNFPPSLLVTGNNVLAVEVHQSSLTSVDIAFGMQVTAVLLAPTVLQFTNQPSDVTIKEAQNATFTGVVTGNGARYQWFKDGAPIPGATASSLTLSNVLVPDAGYYALRVSNTFGILFSRLARLTVLVDPNAPVLLAADWLDATHLSVSFSKPLLLLTATNLANYSVSNTLGAALNLVNATLTNGTNVLFTIAEAAEASANYILSAAGIADLPPAHNVMSLSAVPVARSVALIAFDSFWFYYDPYGPPIDNIDPGANWKDDAYDTSTWGYDAGAFSYSQSSTFVPPVPAATTLGPTPTYSAYFRTDFGFALSPGGLTATLRYAVDDGAVFYLNGLELLRFNMPTGAIGPETLPLIATNAVLVSLTDFPIHFLRNGANLFSAELHQTTTNNTDKFFAAELTARAESLPTGPLLVLGGPGNAQAAEGETATFRVSSVGAMSFQWRLNEIDIPGATNSVLRFAAAMSLNGAQLRCLCIGSENSTLTTNATLHVLPDTVPPGFLSAIANPDNTITLSFSKPLNSATASDAGNYAVTNSEGAPAIVSGATVVNGTNVILTVTGPLAGRYTVLVNNVTDLAATPNPVVPNSAATVGADYFMAMDSAWKYEQSGTDLGTAWRPTNYDDSAWSGPSNALFYVEDAPLPGPKNTLLSPFDSTIITYYFRSRLLTPVAGTNATIRIRHIIDDGMILHLNGKEIYRYNLTPGVLNASTLAIVSVEASLVGPVDVFNITNLVNGTNVLAVELHQGAMVSSDIVMGVELSVHVSSVRLPMPIEVPPAPLVMTSWGNQFALMWTASGAILEGADDVTGPWIPLSASSPFFVPRTNSAAFFRLHQ